MSLAAVNPSMTEQAGQPRLEDLDAVRDFYVWESADLDESVRRSFCFCATPKRIWIRDTPFGDWLRHLVEHVQANHEGQTDFRVEYGEHLFRGHRDLSVSGMLLSLRRIPKGVPTIEQINVPHVWQELFMHTSLLAGGLILIAAVTGQGKSTTMGATVRSRLEKFGGYCRTIEDPPELPLDGPHGDGYCIQTAVDPRLPTEEGYASALRDAMRSYPTIPGGGTMCMIGEVRDKHTASDLLRAAVNGHLVLATVHANTIPSALGRLCGLAEAAMDTNTARDLLSSALRIAIHQHLSLNMKESGWNRGRIDGQLLYSGGSSSAAANAIREGKMASGLNQPIDQQRIIINQFGRLPGNELIKKLDPANAI